MLRHPRTRATSLLVRWRTRPRDPCSICPTIAGMGLQAMAGSQGIRKDDVVVGAHEREVVAVQEPKELPDHHIAVLEDNVHVALLILLLPHGLPADRVHPWRHVAGYHHLAALHAMAAGEEGGWPSSVLG